MRLIAKLSLLLMVLLLTLPALAGAGQDDRFERLRERAELRREMRDLNRERLRARAEVRREQMRLRSALRWHAWDLHRGIHDHYRHEYRDAIRDAVRATRRALREAFRNRW